MSFEKIFFLIFILCFASGDAAKGIIGYRKNSRDARLLRVLIKDTLPLIDEEEKKSPGARQIKTRDFQITRSSL